MQIALNSHSYLEYLHLFAFNGKAGQNAWKHDFVSWSDASCVCRMKETIKKHIHSLKWRWPQGPALWHAVKGGEQAVSGWLIVRLMDTFNSHETSLPLLARSTGAVSHELVLCSLFTRLSDSRFNSIWHTRSTHSLVTYLAMVVARVSRNCQFEVENKLMHHSCHGKKGWDPPSDKVEPRVNLIISPLLSALLFFFFKASHNRRKYTRHPTHLHEIHAHLLDAVGTTNLWYLLGCKTSCFISFHRHFNWILREPKLLQNCGWVSKTLH